MRLFIFLFASFFSINAFSSAITEESKYNSYKVILRQNAASFVTPHLSLADQKLFIDALEDALNEESVSSKTIPLVDQTHFSLTERLRLELIKLKFQQAALIDTEVSREVLNVLSQKMIEDRFLYIIAANERILMDAGEFLIINEAKKQKAYFNLFAQEKNSEIDKKIINDLYFHSPPSQDRVKIFMFCRTNRLFPCLMIMRDSRGNEVKTKEQTLWSHPVLASSYRDLPSHERNGNTPAGIFTIDSVMPSNDQQMSFGKYRRMILNFIPKSNDEKLLKALLPKSSWEHPWWSSSPIARDIGRNLLRIHGTGVINLDPTTSYYPFIRTSGCIANRENTYDGIGYHDQRLLLDSIMTALNLKATYENEINIKGLLYLIEIDDESKAVTLEDLKKFDIFF